MKELVETDFLPTNQHKQLNIMKMSTPYFKCLCLSNYHFEMKLHTVKFRIFVVNYMERIFINWFLQFSPSPCKSLQEDWKVAAYPPKPGIRFTEDSRICTRDCRQVPVYPMYNVNPAIELRHSNFEIVFNLKQKMTFESKIIEEGKMKWIQN